VCKGHVGTLKNTLDKSKQKPTGPVSLLLLAIRLNWKVLPGIVSEAEGVADVNLRGQPVTADTQTGHLYAVYSGTGALRNYGCFSRQSTEL
jgi:hypothetical protein